jgi:hypothetical protein
MSSRYASLHIAAVLLFAAPLLACAAAGESADETLLFQLQELGSGGR